MFAIASYPWPVASAHFEPAGPHPASLDDDADTPAAAERLVRWTCQQWLRFTWYRLRLSAPGSNPKVFSQGDEPIINDQLATPCQVNGGYPIAGHDVGVCTLTRIPQHQIPQQHANQTLANCVVTAVFNNGSLTDRPGSRPVQLQAARTAQFERGYGKSWRTLT
jgi:hypothetical protein